MKRRSKTTSRLGAFVVLSALLAPAAHAETTLRLLSLFAANAAPVTLIESVFSKNVGLASKGEIKIVRSGPETVPVFEQLQPLSAGVFDILFTAPPFHQTQTGVGLIFFAFKADPDALRQAGLMKIAGDHYYERFGVRILTMSFSPGSHFVLDKPLGPDGTLRGRKLRSNPAYEGVIRHLGGTPVTMYPTEAISAMRKGMLDGLAIPAFMSADFKLYEVAKYMTRPVFGQSTYLFLMNAKKLDSLPHNLQKILADEGRKMEAIAAKADIDLVNRDVEVMLKNGVKITNFSDKIGASLNERYNEGILNTASRASPKEVKVLWDMAKSKNLLNQ